jgi:hypothetical protein
METHINSIEDVLIDGLTYRMGPGASYITNRRSVTFYPQGSNIYSSQAGVKLIKMTIAGDEYLDPSTFRIFFDLTNLGGALTRLRPLSGPHIFFRRMRILCGGQLLEDVDNYNRTHEMFLQFVSAEYRNNEDIQGFDSRWDWSRKPNINTNVGMVQTMTGSFKPLSGILNQQKYLPIRFMPLTIELELVNNPTDAIITPLGRAEDGFANPQFNTTNTSTTWQTTNAMAKCDVVTLDNALHNSISKHLLDGNTLTINYSTYLTQEQIISSAVFNVNVIRAVSRLKAVFVTFFSDLFQTRKEYI